MTEAIKTVSVTLLAAHTHGGTDYQKGDAIDVTPAEQAWLEEQGLIQAAASAAPVTDKAK